jgi:hypothetical protein
MNKLVVHHTYIHGMAFDASNNRNHGYPQSVTQAPAPYAPSFAFGVPDSRVVVPPSETLENLIAIRAIVTFHLDPKAGWHRFNLMEGHVSFALFVQPDGSLMGTIFDATSNWLGATSAAGIVTPGVWHTAELQYDGINECTLLLNGQAVASSYAARGAVRSVGPHGIAIGHWPETPGVYTFEGYVRESWLYKYDPVTAANDLLDPCCGKGRAALDATADRLRAAGYTAQQARQQAMALLNFSLETTATVRGTDPGVSQHQRDLSAQAMGAFLRHDSAAYTTALAQLAALANSRLSTGQMHEIRDREQHLVESLPLPLKDWQSLIGDLCLGKTKLDPNQFVTDYERSRKSQPRHHKA